MKKGHSFSKSHSAAMKSIPPKKSKPRTLKIVEPKKKLKSEKPKPKKKVPKTLRIKEPSKPIPKKKMPKTLKIVESGSTLKRFEEQLDKRADDIKEFEDAFESGGSIFDRFAGERYVKKMRTKFNGILKREYKKTTGRTIGFRSPLNKQRVTFVAQKMAALGMNFKLINEIVTNYEKALENEDENPTQHTSAHGGEETKYDSMGVIKEV